MALICAITANAYDTKNSNVYFDGTGWNTKVVQLMFGKSDGSAGCEMTKISNTNLYYLNTPEWNGYTEFCILGAEAVWGWEGGSNYPLATRKGWGLKSTAILKDYELKTNESNILVGNESSLVGTHLSNGYSDLNHTQTINIDGVGSVEVSSVKWS